MLLKIYSNKYFKIIISTLAIAWTLGIKTSDFITVLLLILFYFFYNYVIEKAAKRDQIIGNIFGSALAFFQVIGNYDIFMRQGGKCILAMIGWQCIFSKILCILFRGFDKLNNPHNQKKEKREKGKKVYAVSFLSCIIAWIPYFLTYYPGVLTYDSVSQLNQALGITQFSNHHPVIHTLMIKGLYSIGYALWKNENAAIALYVIFQMLLLAAVFAFLIYRLYKLGVHRNYLIVCAAFFAILPINAMYAITVWKDILFSAVVLMFTIMLWDLDTANRKGNTKSRGFFLCFILLGILMCLLRSNGFYAYIVCIPIMLWLLKKQRIQILVAVAVTLTASGLVKGPVMDSFNVIQPDTIENLSIPIQHIARVIKDEKSLTDDENKLLNEVIDVDKIAKEYASGISDPIKELVREKGNQEYIAEHKKEFFLLWLQLGLRYPGEYIKAQIDQTKGYWTTDVQYWVTSTEVQKCAKELNIYRNSLVPQNVQKIFTYLAERSRDTPLAGMLWSIGFYVWCAFAFIALRIRNKQSVLMFIPVMAIWATLLVATPVYAEFRYIYSIVICTPFFIGVSCGKESTQNLPVISHS